MCCDSLQAVNMVCTSKGSFHWGTDGTLENFTRELEVRKLLSGNEFFVHKTHYLARVYGPIQLPVNMRFAQSAASVPNREVGQLRVQSWFRRRPAWASLLDFHHLPTRSLRLNPSFLCLTNPHTGPKKACVCVAVRE